MTNTAVLQFPSSYVLMDEEEMTYVEGGAYTAYRGMAAWNKIASMIADVTTWWGSAWTLMKVCAGCAAATPVGTIIAVASALGAMLLVASGGVQAAMTGVAICYTLGSGGFQACDSGFWKWNYTSVKAL